MSLRDALVERWFDTEEDHHETATDEQILARIEDLVGEGWHHAGKELERAEWLSTLLRSTVSYPRFLSIGSSDNVVELRIDREKYDEIRALLGTEAISVGTG